MRRALLVRFVCVLLTVCELFSLKSAYALSPFGRRVVFGKMSPHETLFVASTSTPTLRLVANSALLHLAIFDIPGGCDLGELSSAKAASREKPLCLRR